ncbi:ABC-three component system middle component 2 [Paenibacillus sp. 1A_MP2]|uniref:ABC-three component system middle component 2 n=1 Tax=Paenibacillus sp. 1A_MP2 TaxID=3457495 RepID=UPI0004667DD6|nr:hypothetical protein P364_0131705 [Paenibacillus sp. MAEPY2]KGP78266.1 hypothetical protein P363_0132380 [Paenibacillus sp. MAEPY1]
MGELMAEHSANDMAFNSPLEIGLRALIILSVNQPAYLDLQRLVYYDYLVLHTRDIGDPNSPDSIHPATPHRSGEIVVRRKAMQDGLDLMYSRTLLEIVFGGNGVSYIATELSNAFLDLFESEYYKLLRNNAFWVSQFFSEYSDEELKGYIDNKLGSWGGEFMYEALTRSGLE